jgi:hypothetical protein
MADPFPVSDSVLDRYLAGESTPPETAEVERWLAADPGRWRALELLGGDLTGAWDANQGWHRLNERIAEHLMGLDTRKASLTLIGSLIRIALVVLVLLVIALLVNRLAQ